VGFFLLCRSKGSAALTQTHDRLNINIHSVILARREVPAGFLHPDQRGISDRIRWQRVRFGALRRSADFALLQYQAFPIEPKPRGVKHCFRRIQYRISVRALSTKSNPAMGVLMRRSEPNGSAKRSLENRATPGPRLQAPIPAPRARAMWATSGYLTIANHWGTAEEDTTLLSKQSCWPCRSGTDVRGSIQPVSGFALSWLSNHVIPWTRPPAAGLCLALEIRCPFTFEINFQGTQKGR